MPGGCSEAINSYDAAGRVLASTQTTGGVDYSFPDYRYNMLDGLTWEKYPSGRTIQYTYDNGGRINTVAGTLNSTTTPYAGAAMNPIKYTSHHAFDTVPLGNGITETWSYNARLQTTGVQAGSLMSLTFGYSDTQNNGPIMGMATYFFKPSSSSADTFIGLARAITAEAGGIPSSFS